MLVQPIVELATGRVAGAEALARFPDSPARSPDLWFADAAAAGLGVELELSAIRAALCLLDRLPPSTYLSVNASPATVVSEPFLELLSSVPADRLVLELTEHVPVADYDRLAGPLNRLRWRGVRLAVDDAGSGYSSLQHILNIAPDIIKLDAALVRDVDTDPARRSLVASLKMFADRTDAAVVAEGIETEQEHATLMRLNIGFGQGYYLGRPAPQLPDRLAGTRPERRTA
jgi:EAL domain-containing protein (putative c-di-GMP-specific phosphodiesterase class I)